jgi:ATP-dependent Lon protease
MDHSKSNKNSKKNISINIKKLNNDDGDSSSDEDYLPEDDHSNDHSNDAITTSSSSTSDMIDRDINNDILTNFDKKRKRSSSEGDLIYNYKIKEKSKYDSYFKTQNREKQIEIIEKENEIYNYSEVNIPIRYKILYSNLSISTKLIILQKIDSFESMSESDNEYTKLNKWYKGLALIPFDIYAEIPVSIKDGDQKIQKYLYNSYEILQKTIYGQAEAKNKIMQILAQWISNPKSIGQVIALEGPPGVGKTSFVKNGVSKALNRPFSFYALGGATDVCNLEGHSYTYEGAIWGRIVEMLMESKVMNPVIFFDELDKISDTAKGAEITGLLTHLTDFSQNNVFNDKFFSGIELNLSKSLFFFSYNDVNLIDPILKDRLTIVKFNGYNSDEKINITKEFIIPDLLKNIGFCENDITIDNDVIKYIIDKYTYNEHGVRNIKRCVDDLFLKINLLKLIRNNGKGSNDVIDIDYKINNLKFPLKITTEIVDNLLNRKKEKIKKN